MSIVLYNLLAITATGCACFMAYHEISGWGWFLFLAFVTAHVSSGGTDKKEEKDKES